MLQNTPKSISNKITVMGTPSSQAMMGIWNSFLMGSLRGNPNLKGIACPP